MPPTATPPELMAILTTTSKCSHCQQIKAADCFYANRSRPDGLSKECKPCQLETQRKDNNKAKEIDIVAWRLKNAIAKREQRFRKKLTKQIASQAAAAPQVVAQADVHDL